MNDLFNIIQKVEQASIERDKKLADTIDSAIRQQNISGQISSFQQHKEILALVYQKSSAYANLIIIGGYAGMFAIWQFTKTYLNETIVIITALLITTSIILFAGFEVYKMISTAFFMKRLNRILISKVQ